MLSVVNQKYRNMKRRFFPPRGVVRDCLDPGSSCRLLPGRQAGGHDLRKVPSVLLGPLFLLRDSRRLVASALLLAPLPALAAPDTAASVLTVLLSLALILAGFVAVAWFARRYLPGLGAQGVVKLVATTSVGPRERVVVVEVDGTWLLLGVGGGHVRLLHTQPKPASSPAPGDQP